MFGYKSFLTLALIVAGCATPSDVPKRSASSRLTEYQTTLRTFQRRSDSEHIATLLAEAESLIRRAETQLSLEDVDREFVDLVLDAAQAKLVEVSTMLSKEMSVAKSRETETIYSTRAAEIAKLREANDRKLPSTEGDAK